ncbi:MAG: hypothetical protein DRJ98_00045 [Thermoprotei archaeon]|nr:MAG: hypothetical protein DRJ98_00045 [Thermoprotei archaeon]
MDPTWTVQWFKSILILLDDLSVSIDPSSSIGGGDYVLISHAHGDHVAGFRSKGSKICSSLTAELYSVCYGGRVNEATLLHLPAALKLDSLSIELKEAGHILGSAQFLLSHPEHGVLVYTGDLNVEGSIVTSPADVLNCDVLIVDATFGHPHLKFPPRERLYESIATWTQSVVNAGGTAVLYAHPLGKAQELVKVLNQYVDIEPAVHPKIAKVNEVYAKAGVKLRYIEEDREVREALRGGGAYIVPLRPRPSKLEAANPYKAVVTGWAAVFEYNAFDKAFPLSGHSSFPTLIEYVKQVGARRVYTLGYYAEEMANWIRKRLRIEACSLASRLINRAG